MNWLIFGLILLALNSWFGVRDVKNGNATKSAAFTWFVIGWLAYSMIKPIGALLS
jgi:hypothetical protein